MDTFAIHLAERLVGSECIMSSFSASTPVEKFRLYWRTPLLHNDTDARLSTSNDMSEHQWRLVFLDVSVEFHRSKIQTCIGLLLQCTANSECVYMKAPDLTISQLKEHCESVGIDLESTAPDVMARTMASALQGLRKGSTVTLSCQGKMIATDTDLLEYQEPVKMAVLLHYDELEERSPLVLTCASVSKFDSSTADMMLLNFAQQDKLLAESKSEVSDSTDGVNASASDATKAFQRWLNTPLVNDDETSSNEKPSEASSNGKENGSVVAAAKKQPANPYLKKPDSTKPSEVPKAKKQTQPVVPAMKRAPILQVPGWSAVSTARRTKKPKLFAKKQNPSE